MKCSPADVHNPYVKAWLDLNDQGPAAEPIQRRETANRLKQHLGKRVAAASRVEQSHFEMITMATKQATLKADLLEMAFVRCKA